MATLFGHIAIAASAVKAGNNRILKGQYLTIILCSFLLSIIPDFDVISFKFGIPYAAEWGHRGATHSLTFALITSIIFFFLTQLIFKLKKMKTSKFVFLIYFFSIISHTLLDMLTNGGLGCALFWPLDKGRFFFPVTPIPVSPLSIKSSLIYVIAWEFFLIFPVLAITHTLKSKLNIAMKYIFSFFYTTILVVAYWIRLK